MDTAQHWSPTPGASCRRRAAEGPDLLPLAPRTEMDLRAAWQLSRLMRQLQPDVVHAHDAHGVAMTALALSLGGSALHSRFVATRRVDFHIGKNAFSRWKYRQVERFICVVVRSIRRMLISDGIPADRTILVYEGIDLERVSAAPPLNVHEGVLASAQGTGRGQCGSARPTQGAALPRRRGGPRVAARPGRALS